MSCPKHPTEFTFLKEVLKTHNIPSEDKKIITEGITKLFKDTREKIDGGSDSAEKKAKRSEKQCSTAGMVVIVLIALSMAGGGTYIAHCYAPSQFARLIKATNDQIRTTIEVILDTGYLSISLDDPEFVIACIEWLKKAALLYLGNKLVSGTDRVTKLANKVCRGLGLSYRSESSERRRTSRISRRLSKPSRGLSYNTKKYSTLRNRRRSLPSEIQSSDKNQLNAESNSLKSENESVL